MWHFWIQMKFLSDTLTRFRIFYINSKRTLLAFMKTLSTLVFVLGSVVVSAQDECGFDSYHSHRINLSNSQAFEDEINHRIAQRVISVDHSQRDENLTVPVVVHIIHENGDENISDEQVEIAIEQLNHGFANTGPYFLPTGFDTQIRFCLAGTDPDGNFTTGINRVANSLTDMNVPSDDEALKNIIRWDTEKYMNIWVVKSITRDPNSPGVVGYATFPTEHGSNIDGIVCEAAYFGVADNLSKVHIHEAGHYLGLYHTFQDGCTNNDCLLDGDHVCDTPPDNVTFTPICYSGVNSCSTDDDDLSENNPFRPVNLGGLGDQVDQQDNFLDYSGLSCFKNFTLGQADRMTAVLEEVRSSLLEGDRCVTPCLSPFIATVFSSEESTEVGGTISFSAAMPSGVNAVWSVNGVESGTQPVFQFQGNEEGQFEVSVELNNAEPGCLQEYSFVVNVICPISAFFSFDGNSIPPNTSLLFEGDNTGVTAHTWQVNGQTTSTGSTLTNVFNVAGVNVVTHTVTNGLCTDSYSVNVVVGNCLSGREASVMYWNNSSGSAFGFDFNQSGLDIFITEQPSFATVAGHNRATLCTSTGEVLYYANGDIIYDREFNPLPNGNVIANPTAYQGSLLMNAPESDDLVYYFSSDAQPWNNGLRYSVIDNTLNNGFGNVTAIKDVFIEVTGSECYSSIQHCNLVDFWIVYYDSLEEEFHAHLVNSEGVTIDPVVSEIDLSNLTNIEIAPFIVNGKGSRIFLRGSIFEFNQATGEVTQLIESVHPELVSANCFSPSGRYAYFIAGDLESKLYRIDLSLPVSSWADNAELISEITIDYFGSGMMAGPDGRIYYESISGWVSCITNPEATFDELDFQLNYYFFESFINTFPNYHHGYISGASLFPEGPSHVCIGESAVYSASVSECIEQDLDWELIGDGTITELPNGTVSFSPSSSGNVKIAVSTELDCGFVSDTLYVSILPGIQINLGPDIGICSGTTFELTPGTEFDSYEWQDGSTNASITVNSPGTYNVEVMMNGCTAFDEVVVGPTFAGNINLGPDVFLCDGETVLIDAGPNFSDYVWHDGSSGQQFTAYEAGMVYVTATTPCLASDTLIVTDCGQTIDNVLETNVFGDYLFPNPATSDLNLHLGTEASSIEIFDAQGKLVYICGQSKSGMKLILINNLETGVYMILLSGERSRAMRFVKTD